jgi:hypothetical protein
MPTFVPKTTFVATAVGFAPTVDRNKLNAGSEALTAMVMKGFIFCDITTCSPLTADRHFRDLNPLHDSFLLGSFFYPADEGNMFLRNMTDFQRTTRRCIPEGRNLRVE